MRRISWMLTIVMIGVLFLAGCGQKDATSVVKDLDHKMSKLESYAGIGTMTLHSGQQPLEYQVEVWYQNPSYYRIELKNAKKDITQIVLRNDEGVFVLTPSLKKSFRFQSDWPDNQGQVYLYQTLIHSILADKAPQFVTEGDDYVFEVAANYQTDSLVRQKIWLNKQDYAPKQVQVTDAESRVVVEMKFKQFDFSKKFDKDAFDMQRNMTASANIDPQPVSKPAAATPSPAEAVTEITETTETPVGQPDAKKASEPKKESTPTDPATGKEDQGQSVGDPAAEEAGQDDEGHLGPFGFIEPSYIPNGVALGERVEVPDNKNHAVMLRYTGTYTYSIMEERPEDVEVGIGYSEGVNLGFTVGHLVGDEQKTLTWLNEGVKYRITSGDLPLSEMVKIAQSMVDQSGK